MLKIRKFSHIQDRRYREKMSEDKENVDILKVEEEENVDIFIVEVKEI